MVFYSLRQQSLPEILKICCNMSEHFTVEIKCNFFLFSFTYFLSDQPYHSCSVGTGDWSLDSLGFIPVSTILTFLCAELTSFHLLWSYMRVHICIYVYIYVQNFNFRFLYAISNRVIMNKIWRWIQRTFFFLFNGSAISVISNQMYSHENQLFECFQT